MGQGIFTSILILVALDPCLGPECTPLISPQAGRFCLYFSSRSSISLLVVLGGGEEFTSLFPAASGFCFVVWKDPGKWVGHCTCLPEALDLFLCIFATDGASLWSSALCPVFFEENTVSKTLLNSALTLPL